MFQRHKRNNIVNKFLLPGDKFIPGMHLRQTGFTYSPCGTLTKNKERVKKFLKKQEIQDIYIPNKSTTI